MNTKVLDWSYTEAFDGKVPGYGACRAVVGEYAGLLPVKPTGPDHESGFVVSAFSGYTFRAALPHGRDVIYLRIPHKPGDGRMAGGDHGTDQALEWDVDHWAVRGTLYGPNGLTYGYGDFLTICGSRPEWQRTGGGWYNGLGAVVPCLANHDDEARGIYEYTDFGDVAIGQGADGIAVVSFRMPSGVYEPLRRFDPRPVSERSHPADMRFMVIDREASQFGIAIPELKSRKTYFCWPTWAELYALPT